MPPPGAVLDTVTATLADVLVFPAASRATAVSVWPPAAAVVVSHDVAYGEAVSSAPRFEPSSLNWTPATPTLSLAVAVTETTPERVAPAAGEAIVTEGCVPSRVVNVKSPDVPRLPAASRDLTR